MEKGLEQFVPNLMHPVIFRRLFNFFKGHFLFDFTLTTFGNLVIEIFWCEMVAISKDLIVLPLWQLIILFFTCLLYTSDAADE